jgi:hypothetical protein
LSAARELPLDARGEEKFTEKLRFDPHEFCGRGVSELSEAAKKWIFE